MAHFNITAYQEMFTEQHVEAKDAQEAVLNFQAKLKRGGVVWQPSAEGMDFTVSEIDEAGHVLSEISSDSVDILIKA
jgi:hypothetical protein